MFLFIWLYNNVLQHKKASCPITSFILSQNWLSSIINNSQTVERAQMSNKEDVVSNRGTMARELEILVSLRGSLSLKSV